MPLPIPLPNNATDQVRFLLETATAENAEIVVRELREKLRLCPVGSSVGVDGGMVADSSGEETEAPWFNSGAGDFFLFVSILFFLLLWFRVFGNVMSGCKKNYLVF